MVGEIWGSLVVGLFAVPDYLKASCLQAGSAGLLYLNGNLLVCQLIGLLFVVGWVTTLMRPFFAVVHSLGWLW